MSEIMLHNKIKNVKYRSLLGGYKTFSLNFLMAQFLNTHTIVQDERHKEQKYDEIVTSHNTKENQIKRSHQSFKPNLSTSSKMFSLKHVENKCKIELLDQNVNGDHSYYLQTDTNISAFSNNNTPDVEKCEKERPKNEIKTSQNSKEEEIKQSCQNFESNLTNNSEMFLLKHVESKHNIELLEQGVDHHEIKFKKNREPEKYYCDQCNYSTQYQHYIRRHKFKHFEKKSHYCDQCDYSTKNYCHLKLHKLNHSGQKSYHCEECNYATNMLCNLKVHRLKHIRKKQLKCDQCKFTTNYQRNLKHHLIRHIGKYHHDVKQFEKEKSNDVTSDNTQTKQSSHSLKNSSSSPSSELLLEKLVEPELKSETIYQNVNVDYSHLQVETHISHWCDHPQDIPHVQQSEKEIRNEIIISQNTKEIKQSHLHLKPNLTACLEMLLLKRIEPKYNIELLDQNVKDNEVSVKNPKDQDKYHCDQCNYSTQYQYYIKRHKFKHSEKELHHCEECGYSTKNYSHLKIHKFNHSGQKQHHCEECNYATNMLCNLRVHRLKHTEVKKFKCNQCEFTTKYRRYLKHHAIRHQSK